MIQVKLGGEPAMPEFGTCQRLVAPPVVVPVVVDDRERGGAAALALAAMPEVVCEVRRLDLGDYEVDGQLLVERKRLPDLVASIEDGRLFRQACRLARSTLRPLLLLEGSAAELAGCRMRREAIQGALITVSLVWGIPVLRAVDGAESARLMLFAARQLRRAAGGAVFRPGRRPRGKKRAQLRVLQGLPGVGKMRAERLLAAFGTVEAVMAATEPALREVEGIGAETAAGIRWAVGAGASAHCWRARQPARPPGNPQRNSRGSVTRPVRAEAAAV
jgi:ERCC4-type nuclease